MAGYFKAALCAAAIVFASDAQAASFLSVDIVAKGSGTGSQGSRSGLFPTRNYTFDTFYTSLFFNLDGQYGPQVGTDTLRVLGTISVPYVRGLFTAAGFDFGATYPLQQFVAFDIAGAACYANSSPTTVTTGYAAIDPSCSPFKVSFSDGFAVAGYNFTGVVSSINFRVIEAERLPDITFSIPEPSTWALLLAGFGMVGYTMRRKRTAFALV